MKVKLKSPNMMHLGSKLASAKKSLAHWEEFRRKNPDKDDKLGFSIISYFKEKVERLEAQIDKISSENHSERTKKKETK